MTSFISDQDFTTPAHVRAAARVERESRHEPRNPPDTPARPLLAVIFLAAVWLVVSSVPFGYIGAGRYDAFWSDAVTGTTLAVVTAIRMLHRQSSAFGWVTGGLAGWLLAAPLVLQYGWSRSTVNDVVLGVLVLTCAALTTADDHRDGP